MIFATLLLLYVIVGGPKITQIAISRQISLASLPPPGIDGCEKEEDRRDIWETSKASLVGALASIK